MKEEYKTMLDEVNVQYNYILEIQEKMKELEKGDVRIRALKGAIEAKKGWIEDAVEYFSNEGWNCFLKDGRYIISEKEKDNADGPDFE